LLGVRRAGRSPDRRSPDGKVRSCVVVGTAWSWGQEVIVGKGIGER